MTDVLKDLEQTLLGASAAVIRRQTMWDFEFSTGLKLHVEAVWRLRDAEAIKVTSSDDGHKFGLPASVDAQARATALLTGCTVTGVDLNSVTADLEITFSNGVVLDVLTDSMGNESWVAYLKGDTWAVGANGIGLR
ncbi:DUF6188 family protein [Allosphingosinicella sp.]|uniref:DUF6188 family protein n=1 Tax=Allosphingosinicella sp. TaxID=2823234 RepID=UPI00378405A9